MLRLTSISDWRHVSSSENSADILSRGLGVSDLIKSTNWWNGPPFLKQIDCHWPSQNFEQTRELSERMGLVVAATAAEPSLVRVFCDRYSNLGKMLRVVAYCLRVGRRQQARPREKFITHNEMNEALHTVIKIVQREIFPEEYRALSKGRIIDGSSSVSSLTPFIDNTGMIRVGGRLNSAALPCKARHPMLLPKSHPLTRLIVRREHVRNLYSGLQATVHALRRQFWPLAARSVARGIILKCITCFKRGPITSEAKMADLPKNRVTPSRPLEHAGIDCAGPISLKEGKRRNAKIHKAYIAMFVCFATRAVHVELVNDLSTNAFIGALKRFVSRRGKPACVYSDNGTNFVGAKKQLDKWYQITSSKQAQSEIKIFCHEREILWKFISPQAPHFGGLWEAAIKSAKYHMRRIIDDAHLNFEEMQTVLCKIEAVLNSRPLTPLSKDPNDLACITPGHFLIGSELNSFPIPDLTDQKENRLLRWQRIEQLRQHFWQRWSREYLHTLMQRQKWRANKGEQLKVGQLALILHRGLGPLQWTLGRVEQIYPGNNGNVRTAMLKTAKESTTRPLTQLAILPLSDDEAA